MGGDRALWQGLGGGGWSLWTQLWAAAVGSSQKPSSSHCWFPLPGHCGLDVYLTSVLSLSPPEAGAFCREACPSGAGKICE